MAQGIELCDDNNTADLDGCNSTCQIETGWTIVSTTSGLTTMGPVCGDFYLRSTEECEDGNTAINDGCSSTCMFESGYSSLAV